MGFYEPFVPSRMGHIGGVVYLRSHSRGSIDLSPRVAPTEVYDPSDMTHPGGEELIMKIIPNKLVAKVYQILTNQGKVPMPRYSGPILPAPLLRKNATACEESYYSCGPHRTYATW